MKRCSKCGEEKELIVEINPSQRWCKYCQRQNAKRRYAESPQVFREAARERRKSGEWVRGGLKPATCGVCGKSYKARGDGFGKYCSLGCVHESQKMGATVQCRECGKNIYVPKSRKDGDRGIYCSKECANKARTLYSPAQLKLSSRIRGGIIKSIKRGSKAGRRWESLVGFTVEQLMTHLEKKFTSEMSWENYGTYWHIDHKTPIAVFNFNRPEDIDFRLCWSIKNLQPLEAKENMSKGAKIQEPFQPSLAISMSAGG